MNKPWISIIGINQDDVSVCSKLATKALSESDIIIGAERHIKQFKYYKERSQNLPIPLEKTIQILKRNRGKKIVLLVSGNAFWFGLGNLISNHFNREDWQCFQSPSTFSLASAEMGWNMENVLFFGLHAKKNQLIRPFVAPGVRLIILLKDGSSVKELTEYFSNIGFGESKFTIFESLGYKSFRKRSIIAKKNSIKKINHPVCVAIETKGNGLVIPKNSGKPDKFFENDGQLTKQYVRSITISSLAPKPFEHLWDLGAGSGSIALEWLLSDKTTVASAVEKNKKRTKFIGRNCEKFGIDRINIINDDIKNIFKKLKKPNAIFIGGGLDKSLFEKIWNFIPKKTRIVVNSVTIETESCMTNLFNIYGGSLMRIELSDIKMIGNKHSWSRNYPIVQWKIEK